jgi:nucleoside-diphosphate-sugar epimerase/L-ascorbate metabolism protein UlaG (beta-lactamase superfamily)
MKTNYPERSPRSVSVTWYGQAGFRLTAGNSRVLIDPFLTDRSDRRYPPPATAADFADVTLVLCTHEHVDHLDLPFLREFCSVNSGAPIVVPAPVTEIAVKGGLDAGRLVAAVPAEELSEGDVMVHPVPALHGIGGDEPVVYEFSSGGGPVRFLGYAVEIGGIRFFHSGDGLVYPELPGTVSALAPDVLMIPINGRDHMRESRGIVGNMNETEAAWLCSEVAPSYVIPMHYEAIAHNTGDPGHFTTLVHESGGETAVLVPPLAKSITLALPPAGVLVALTLAQAEVCSMPVSTERFLVTGANGCIGAWAVRLLLDEGVPVVATDLSADPRRFQLVSQGRADDKVEFDQLDVTITEDVTAMVADRGITHIVHLAGLQLPFCAANPPLGAMVNVVGTVNVFEAIRAAGGHIGLAFASSAAVFGAAAGHQAGLVTDTSALLPDSFYGVYKAANEGTAKVYSTEHAIGSICLRPFVVYGLGRDQGMTSDPTKAMLAAAAGVPFRIKFGGSVLLTYAPDCARAFIAAARAAAGSGEAVSLNVPGHRIGVPALADLIERVLPGSGRLITWDSTILRIPSLLAGSALRDAVGDLPSVPLADGVRETIEGFQAALAAGLVSAVPS